MVLYASLTRRNASSPSKLTVVSLISYDGTKLVFTYLTRITCHLYFHCLIATAVCIRIKI